DNADFFFMSYSYHEGYVENFIFVPKYFFTERIIEKREPLSPNARRAGWVGCNILLGDIPEEGRISIINNRQVENKNEVCGKVNKTGFISNFSLSSRGWIIDVLNCVNRINSQEFELADLYRFETQFSIVHPQNRNIKAKIRQQLQLLRDMGLIEFLGNGKYKKI
ncbi:MAG: DpnI domain-containing protein, partial [Clostridiaceae bacterium]|nr:DpnI domain-containing protein [Clostridiaceae bacterium]